MRWSGSLVLTILAVVLFLVGFVLVLSDDAVETKTLLLLGFGGLAAFAAAHLPLP